MNRLQKIGLANMERLADVDGRRREMEYERNALESESQANAIGSLIGTVGGLGMAGYKEYKKGEFDTDVTNAEAARNQFPDETSYQESLKKNYSPEVQKEVAWRRTLPKEGRDYVGLDDAAPEWSKKTSVTANRDAQGNALPASTWALPPSTADRQVVFAKTPTRSLYASTLNSTTPQFQEALTGVMSVWQPHIGGQ